jgi:hypothetical protein
MSRVHGTPTRLDFDLLEDVIRVIEGAPSEARVPDEITRHYKTLASPFTGDRCCVRVDARKCLSGRATWDYDVSRSSNWKALRRVVVGRFVGNR